MSQYGDEKKTFADRLIGWGIAKNERQAQSILIGVIVIALLVMAYNFWRILTGS